MNMKLAISNIAWYRDRPIEDFLKFVQPLGCEGLELATSLIWEKPPTTLQVNETRRMIEDAGMVVTGLQSLLYTRQELKLFKSADNMQKTIDYLTAQMDLCRGLGGEVLVFGSPRNRNRGNMEVEKAYSFAVNFFQKIGERAGERGVFFCIEPLGKTETDFINTVAEAEQLILDAGNPIGLGLHIDTKGLFDEKEYSANYLTKSFSRAKHVHLNDPGLMPPGSTGCDHNLIRKKLDGSNYSRFLSIEMKRQEHDLENGIKRAIDYVKKIYFT